MQPDRLDFDGLPDLSCAEYTIILPHEAACELIAGRVPHDVLIACLSSVIAITATPAESVTRPRKRLARSIGAAMVQGGIIVGHVKSAGRL